MHSRINRALALLLVVSSYAFSIPCFADSLTADDIARHLGIFAWESTVDLPPGSFTVALEHVVNGKVAETVAGGLTGPKDDESGRRLVILASPTPAGVKTTILIGHSSTFNVDEHTASVQLTGQISLPPHIQEGDYCLGGEYRQKDGSILVTTKIEGLEDGLALSVMKEH